ncbi:MAG: ABC transporter permease [Candidatus Omnitrophica bacterium]|nr:ABC transporter permease [Candidatus Omnitrophota bacterium]
MKNQPRFLVLSWMVLGMLTAAPSQTRASAETPALHVLEEIPVQHSGRVKPFQSFAAESVLYVTGKSRFGDMPVTELVWHWMAEPENWRNKPLIPVAYKTLKDEFGLMLVHGRVSPEIALQHKPFTEKVQQAAEKRARKDKLTELERKRLEVYERATAFEEIAGGGTPGWLAHPEELRAGWLPLQSILSEEGQHAAARFYPEEKVKVFAQSVTGILEAARGGTVAALPEASVKALAAALEDLFSSRQVILDRSLIAKENLYNRAKPFHLSWILYLVSFALSLVVLLAGERARSRLFFLSAGSVVCFAAGFLIHAWGFYLRCLIAGRPPVSNMYESMIWVSWSVALVALILDAVYRNVFIRNTAAVTAAATLLIAENFPVALNPAISPLVPVLRSNFWLTVHVLTITLSYGAFLLAWGLGHVIVFTYALAPGAEERKRRLSQFLYRTLQIGVVLLAAGTILGGVWANYSWGRFWGWDPKETWALIALLGYLAVLHGRFSGLLGDFGIAVGSIAAFLGVLMAWYGVNFVLAAGLHSYGFGGGGLGYVLAVCAADLLITALGVILYKKSRSVTPS